MDDDTTRRRRIPPFPPDSPSLPLPPPRSSGGAHFASALEEALAVAQQVKQSGDFLVEGSDPVGHGRRVDLISSNVGRPSIEQIVANDRSMVSLPANLLGIESFVPGLRKKKPEEVLQILTERFRREPTREHGLVLQHAINRTANSGPITGHMSEEIKKAVEVFHSRQKPAADGKPEGDDIFYWAYVDGNFGGASLFGDLTQGWIYLRTSYVGNAMNDKISSLVLSCTSDEAGGNLAIFENVNFVGRYQNYGVTVPAGVNGYVEEDVSYVGDDFNDITSSILAIRRFPNETDPVSIGALLPPNAITDIVDRQKGISSAGAPIITWDLWPTGPTSGSDWHPNDPGKRFIYIIVPITVHTPWPYPDAYAQARFWVYIYVDNSGILQGYTDYWGYYVAPCCFLTSCITGQIASNLAQQIPGLTGQVDGLVGNALALANGGGPYQFSYFLPGKGQFTGSTWDDVTVVAVRR